MRMKDRILITGINGFAGSHLAEVVLGKGLEVFGTIRLRSNLDSISHIKKDLRLIECDLRDSTSVYKMLKAAKPDKIFHLAAQAFVPTSLNAPLDSLHNNIALTVNIFEIVQQFDIAPRILIVGSCDEYGLVKAGEIPITESNPLRPLSPYAVSKIAQDMLGFQYFKSYGLSIVRTRAFNHTGYRQNEAFALSSFAKQIAEIENEKREHFLSVGNLEARKDFLDVRDVVRAYWLALEKCDFGEVYNIASGKSRSIMEYLNILLSYSKSKIEIKPDPKRMRPSEILLIQGDSKKFREKTGWKPEIEMEQTLYDLLAYWRTVLKKR
jgi:GDP-4-dehydro-6-deoxy-D-mannose reductase